MAIAADLTMIVSRALPQANQDNTTVTGRAGRYGDQYNVSLVPTTHVLSDEGSYFIATNPVPGTAIVFAVNTAVSETAGYYFALKNNASANDPASKRIYLDYIRMICTVAPASATSGHLVIKLDNVNSYTSGGSTIVPVNANMDAVTGTIAQLYAGALTTPVRGSAARLVHRSVLRSVISVVNDEWIINFGPVEFAGAISDLAGTLAKRMIVPAAPVIIGPQQWLLVQPYFPANAATPPQFEFELGWWER